MNKPKGKIKGVGVWLALSLILMLATNAAADWATDYTETCDAGYPNDPWYIKATATGGSTAGVSGGWCYLTDTSDTTYWNVRYNVSNTSPDALRVNWT